VVSIIDNVIIGTKEEEGHNKVVEKIVRRLAKNNLYINQKNICRRYRK